MGYGNPDAKISLARKLERGEVRTEVVDTAVEIVASSEGMKPITETDDGCIDGRLAEALYYPTESEAKEPFLVTNIEEPAKHKRPKVAGGGYITALTMKLALDPEVTTVNEDIKGVVDHLTQLGVYCGTHTGEHSHGGGVDCGANDRFDEILVRFRDQYGDITGSVHGAMRLLGVEYDNEVAETVRAGIARTLSHETYFTGSNGEARFGVIMNGISRAQQELGVDAPVSVSKHLKGTHNEVLIVLNTVHGTTLSQAEFAERMQVAFPDIPENQLPQVFVCDVWRVDDLAHAMAKDREDTEWAYNIAFQAGLGFQFAAAAHLTDGSLRTLVVSE